MPKPKPPTPAAAAALHIFKPGRHTAMSGQALSFSETDLQATVAAYNPALHEAPLVVGHPSHDMPAYGWIKGLQFCDGGIDATPAQVNPDFADMVAAGAFKKISAAFYSPDAPQNPVPGVYYLRHVGFLGAQAPAVKGLRSPSFADGEEGVVTFSEWDDVTNAALWRNLREYFIANMGQDKADAVIPGYMVSSLEQAAQDEVREAATETPGAAGGDCCATPAPTSAFSEHNPKESPVTPAEKTALEAENARLRDELARNLAIQTHAANLSFCEGQPGVTPAWRDVAVATLDHFALLPVAVEFGEGEARAPLADRFKAFLASLPSAVAFGEQATAQRAAGTADKGTVEFAAPEGFVADPGAMAAWRRTKAYEKEHGVSFSEAAHAVEFGG